MSVRGPRRLVRLRRGCRTLAADDGRSDERDGNGQSHGRHDGRRRPTPAAHVELLPQPHLIGSLLVFSEDQILHELLALELAKLHVRLDAAVQRHADLPRTRVHVRILDRGLVPEVIGPGPRDAFDDMQAVGMEVSGPVQESRVHGALFVHGPDRSAHEPGAVDDQRLALPAPVRPSHPGIGGRGLLAVHVDGAQGARVLREHDDVLVRLENLNRIRHVHHPRHARQVALDLRVFPQCASRRTPVLRERVGPVGDRAALDHAQSRGTACAAPSCRTGPGRAAWPSRSQWAVFMACQIPFRFGLPVDVRERGRPTPVPLQQPGTRTPAVRPRRQSPARREAGWPGRHESRLT